jgi:hypothetical protein
MLGADVGGNVRVVAVPQAAGGVDGGRTGGGGGGVVKQPTVTKEQLAQRRPPPVKGVYSPRLSQVEPLQSADPLGIQISLPSHGSEPVATPLSSQPEGPDVGLPGVYWTASGMSGSSTSTKPGFIVLNIIVAPNSRSNPINDSKILRRPLLLLSGLGPLVIYRTPP